MTNTSFWGKFRNIPFLFQKPNLVKMKRSTYLDTTIQELSLLKVEILYVENSNSKLTFYRFLALHCACTARNTSPPCKCRILSSLSRYTSIEFQLSLILYSCHSRRDKVVDHNQLSLPSRSSSDEKWTATLFKTRE